MDDLPYPFEMKKIDIGDDIEIAYADLGGGKETLKSEIGRAHV